jgi:hypothetical protein
MFQGQSYYILMNNNTAHYNYSHIGRVPLTNKNDNAISSGYNSIPT